MERKKGHKEDRFPFLFSPIQAGGIRLKNRAVVLPVHTGYAYPDGSVSPLLMRTYEQLAGSGAAMVVVANAAVASDGRVSRYNLRVDRDAFLPGLEKLAAAIKNRGAIACLQLNHAGRFAKTDRPLLPSPITGANLAFNMDSLKQFMEFFPFEKRFALTRTLVRQINSWFVPMDDTDVARIIDDFARAAFRACQAGFDMVELHGANGYLLCQFLSRFTNRLSQDLGGSLEARFRFPLAVLKGVRQALPKGFPVGFRLMVDEWVPDGIDSVESSIFGERLQKEGIAYLSASVATYNSMFTHAAMAYMAEEAYLKESLAGLKKKIFVPIVISGRMLSPAVADAVIRDGIADLVGLGRPIRTDPGWIKKASGRPGKIISCINCNWCIRQVILDKGFDCVRWPRRLREKIRFEHRRLGRSPDVLWVISGESDRTCFETMPPGFLRDRKDDTLPRVLLLQGREVKSRRPGESADLIEWIKRITGVPPDSKRTVSLLTGTPGEQPDRAVREAILKGGYGRILVAGRPITPWHWKLIYGERGKVMGFLNPNKRLNTIIVPVDFSPATLMILDFLRTSILGYPGFSVAVVHVLSGRPGPARKRWRDLTAVAGVDLTDGLTFLPLKGDVVSTLNQAIHDGKYGTVIMGKRGLSGIKRWLAGSVSTGVFRAVTDQTVFLVD